MNLKFKGTLAVIGDITKVSEKFTKRSFVLIDEESKYNNTIEFQLTQDNVYLIDGYNVGDVVDVEFKLSGRKWDSPKGETKYFNTLEVSSIPAKGGKKASIKPSTGQGGLAPNVEFTDLPF